MKRQAALKALKDLKKSGEASEKGEPAALSEFAGEQAATLPGADKGPLFGRCRTTACVSALVADGSLAVLTAILTNARAIS